MGANKGAGGSARLSFSIQKILQVQMEALMNRAMDLEEILELFKD